MKLGKNKLTFFERLLGQQAPSTDSIDMPSLQGVDTSNPYYLENMGEQPIANITTSQSPRVGGLLPDIVAGYNENRNTPIGLNNFGDNQLSDGRNKGFAYRMGEALGSTARIADSPVGRGLLMAGVVGATGGGALPALAYGGMAGVGNQGYRMRDKFYRQQLADEGVNTSDIRGYLDDDIYKNMLTMKQLRDNAEYRNAYLAGQQEQNKIANQFRRDQLERQARQDQLNNYFQGQRIAQGWANLSDKQKAREMALQAKQNADTYGDIQSQLDNFQKTFKTVNNPYRYRVFGGASEKLNTLSNEEANFNAQRTLLFNQIARKLGGEKGVLSDKDIARVEAALPKLTDTYEQKLAKMDALYALLDIKRGSANQMANNVNATNYDDGWAF